jgi:thiol-disulfide isomerase/thioredoxin
MNKTSIPIIESDDNFSEIFDVKLSKYKKYVFLDFYTNKCVPCKQFNPYFEDIYNKFKKYNNLKFMKINVSKPNKVKKIISSDFFDIDAIPTFIIAELNMDNSINELYRITGVKDNLSNMRSEMINVLKTLELKIL